MLIVLSLYTVLIYLIFIKFNLLPWNNGTKSLVGLVGLIIALVVIGALNYLTPSGRVVVQGATVEIMPNVAGTVVEVAAEPNELVREGDLLFRIDPEPFALEVARLEGALEDARAGVAALDADLAAAEADIARLEAQLVFGIQRRDDIVELAERGASARFQMQEAVSTIEQTQASLDAARARAQGVEVAIASQVDGVAASVVQAENALATAKWELGQTEVTAPSDGMVTALTLRPGQRVTKLRSAMAFLPSEELGLSGLFSQSGAHAFEVGTEVEVAMQPLPGTSFTTTVEAIVPGVAEGSLSGATGALPSIAEFLGTSHFLVRLKLPEDFPEHARRLGMTGSATHFSEDAGAVELLARILFWLQMQANYL